MRATDCLIWFVPESGERREAETPLAPAFSKQRGHDRTGPDGLWGGRLVTQGVGEGVWMARRPALPTGEHTGTGALEHSSWETTGWLAACGLPPLGQG